MYRLNCQVCTKADLQLMNFRVVSTGSINDNISCPLVTGLMETFDSPPLGLYGIADAVPTLSKKLLLPFTDMNRLDPAHDAYDYCLSKLRICMDS